ncbi:RNA polymerase-binding protein DksA [Sulfurimonas sp. MAG313]|nr:RNA polymerase-binding protein DksA [Sulfurimonas sp. MAG313]MDF1881631.1 RNA polymerase-binding protein DksA [Sulfurimonas sp. MAG313]
MQEKELEFFKIQLLDAKEHILQNVNLASKELEQLQNQENNDDMDFASMRSDALIEQVISDQQNAELADIEHALSRIENGNYNICEMCTEAIGISRLKAKPYAKFCMTCRPLYEKSQ